MDHDVAQNAMRTLTQTFARADFVDDAGGLSGHVDFADAIPAGAVIMGARFDCGEGFQADFPIRATLDFSAAHDGSRTMRAVDAAGELADFTNPLIAGDGGPETTGAVGFGRYQVDDLRPRLTLSSATNWPGLVTTGVITMTVFYLPVVP